MLYRPPAVLVSPMLAERAIIDGIHSAHRASWYRTVPVTQRVYVLMPAIENHVVLIAIIPATAAALGDDVDGISGGIVDGEVRGRSRGQHSRSRCCVGAAGHRMGSHRVEGVG